MKVNVKIVFLICALLFCNIQTVKIDAATTDDKVGQYVNSFIAAVSDEPVQISDKRILYNEEGETAALLYELSPKGYIVIEPNECEVIEFSLANAYPYVENEINYYNGPLQYYVKTGELFQHSRSGSVIDVEEYREIRSGYESGTKSTEANSPYSMLASIPSSNKLGTKLRTFSYNPDGRCGSVAAAILFAYYHDAIDSSMVPSYLLSDSNGKIFTDYLKPHLEDIDGMSGSHTEEVVSGMRWYIATRGLYDKYSVYSVYNPDYITLVNCINIGRPSIVRLISDEEDDLPYKNHWVVGYGYRNLNFANKDDCFVILNDGWGKNEVEVKWSYVTRLVFLNKPD